MKIDFTPRLEMSWVALGVGVANIGVGIWQSSKAKKAAKRNKLTAFKTSDEAHDINHLSEYYAQQGFDALTFSRLENNINRGASASISSAERLGATPNVVGDIYDKELEAFFRLAGDDKKLQFEHMNQYLNSLANLDQNKGAEWQSAENIKKDALQQAAIDKQNGMANIMSGLNTASSAYAMHLERGLYEDRTDAINKLGVSEGAPVTKTMDGIQSIFPSVNNAVTQVTQSIDRDNLMLRWPMQHTN